MEMLANDSFGSPERFVWVFGMVFVVLPFDPKWQAARLSPAAANIRMCFLFMVALVSDKVLRADAFVVDDAAYCLREHIGNGKLLHFCATVGVRNGVCEDEFFKC